MNCTRGGNVVENSFQPFVSFSSMNYFGNPDFIIHDKVNGTIISNTQSIKGRLFDRDKAFNVRTRTTIIGILFEILQTGFDSVLRSSF